MTNRIFGPNGQLIPPTPKNEKTLPFDAIPVPAWLDEERNKKLGQLKRHINEYRSEVMAVQHAALQKCLPEYRDRLRGYFVSQLQAMELVEGLVELSQKTGYVVPQGWVQV